MITRKFIPLFILLLCIISLLPAQVPKWTLDVGEQIKDYSFLQEGKFLFLTNYEHSWLFDAGSGAKVYELHVKNYENKGVHQLVGEKYLVGTSDGLQCYNALTGKQIWQQEYDKVDQDEYTNLSFRNNNAVLRYAKIHIGVNLATGKELFRMNISYNSGLVEKGSWNWISLENQNKLMVLLDDDKLGLFSFDNGKQVFEGKDYEISMKVVEKGFDWCYRSPDEHYALFLLDSHVAVVDVEQNKEIDRKEIQQQNDLPPIMSTEHGCAILGKDKVMFFSDSKGTLTEIQVEAGDFRTFDIKKVGTKDIFFAGLSDAMFAIGLADGKVLWRTAEKDPNFEGYAHHYIKMEGDNLILTYTRGSGYSDDGTNVHVMSINALTGKVNYKTPAIFNSRLYIPNWTRSLGKFIVSTLAGQKNIFGYENIGFSYTTEEFEGNLVFGLISTNMLRNPDTKEEPGDGVVIVNPKTGQILFKDYVRVSDYSSSPPIAPEMKPVILEKKMFLIGDENIAGYDLSAKKKIWVSEKLLKGIPREAMLVDNVLYVKFGERKFNVILEPPKGLFGTLGMKIDDKYDIDPYGFAAYDANTGKQMWQIETKVDPGFLTPDFSLKNNYDPTSKRLYFADEENIYALQMRADGGKYDYTINLSKNGLGEMPFKETYAIQEWPIGRKSITSSSSSIGSTKFSTTTTTTEIGGADYNKFISATEEADAACQYQGWGSTIWGATAKKTLCAVYVGTHVFAIGKEGIALFDAADGKALWKHGWDYDPKDIQYVPKIFNSKLVYCLNRKLMCIDLGNGETLWQNEEAKRPLFFNSPNENYLYVIDEEAIRGYEIKRQK